MKKYNKILLKSIVLQATVIMDQSSMKIYGVGHGEGDARQNKPGVSPTGVDAGWDTDL